jgi:hypothetical protein
LKRILTLIVLTSAVVAISGRIGDSQTRKDGSPSQRRARVGVVVSPRAPISVGTTTATITDDQIVLQYAINNRSGGQVREFELLAFTLDRDGQVKGGEGWTVRDNLVDSQAESFVRIMKTNLTPEDRLTLTVWRASGEAGTFEVNRTELNDLLRPRAATERQSATRRLVKAAMTEGEYCQDRLAVATSSCSCGVKSFSCNPTTGEYSFSCFTKAESPAQCKQGENESE